MKKFELLGRSLNRTEMKKIKGGLAVEPGDEVGCDEKTCAANSTSSKTCKCGTHSSNSGKCMCVTVS